MREHRDAGGGKTGSQPRGVLRELGGDARNRHGVVGYGGGGVGYCGGGVGVVGRNRFLKQTATASPVSRTPAGEKRSEQS